MGFKLQSATPLNPMRCSNRECGDELHGKDRVNQGTKTTPIVLVPHSLFIMIHYIEHLVHIFIFVHCHFTLNLWDFVWFFLSTLAVCPPLTPHCGVVETRERTLRSRLNSLRDPFSEMFSHWRVMNGLRSCWRNCSKVGTRGATRRPLMEKCNIRKFHK